MPMQSFIVRSIRLVFALQLALWSAGCIYWQTLEDPPELQKLPPDAKVYPSPLLDKSVLVQDVEKLEAENLKKYGNIYYFINDIKIKNQKVSDRDDFVIDFVNFFHWTTETPIIKTRNPLYR